MVNREKLLGILKFYNPAVGERIIRKTLSLNSKIDRERLLVQFYEWVLLETVGAYPKKFYPSEIKKKLFIIWKLFILIT